MKAIIFRKVKKMLFLLIVAAGITGMSGCVREDVGSELPTPSNGNQVTITATVPGLQIPTTRSMDGVPEAAIKTIDLLLFDNTPKLIDRVEIAESEITYVGGADYKVTLEAATLPVNTVTVVMIANASAEVSTAAVTNNSKAVVLAALTHKTPSGDWNTTNSVDYTPIPMYGEIAKSDIGGSKKIELTRMLARVDVKNSASDFKVLEISVVNYNTQGNIAPAWDTDGKILESGDSGYPYANNVNPPAPTSGWGKKIGDKLTYTTTLAVGQEYLGEIYLYEAVKNPNDPMVENNTHKEAICLIVKGTWTDTDLGDGDQSGTYYYRIDFTAAQGALQKPEEVEYMPVYRNHLYEFTLSAVKGVGFPATAAGFESALKSFGVLNNMKTELHVVNQSGIKNMVFNGQHYIGLGDEVELGSEVDNELSVRCMTNYAFGWQIDKSKGTNGIEWVSGASGWLSAGKSGNDTDKDANIELKTITSNVGTSSVPDARKAYVHLIAGKLTHKLLVSQEGLYSEFDVSSLSMTFNYAGSSTTNTVAITSRNTIKSADGTTSTLPVEWIAEYSDTGADGTWTTTSSWLTFPANGPGGNAVNYTAKAQAQVADVGYNEKDKEIQNTDIKGSADSPYDLSTGGVSGPPQNTSNCYVLNAAGHYKLPLVYGNAIKNGVHNPSAYIGSAEESSSFYLTTFVRHDDEAISGPYIWDQTSPVYPSTAKVIWMDAPGLIANVRLDSDKKYLIFETAPNVAITQGNAVVAVCDAHGTVLWSWHIWVTPQSFFNAAAPQTLAAVNRTSFTNHFMTVNLGWDTGREAMEFPARNQKIRITQTGIENPKTQVITIDQTAGLIPMSGNNGPYWQGGRKDPILPFFGLGGGTNKTFWDGEGNTLTFTAVTNRLLIKTLGGVIQTPQIHYGYSSRPWYINPILQSDGIGQFFNLWDMDNCGDYEFGEWSIKTVYCPCPVGFTMPRAKAFSNFFDPLVNGIADEMNSNPKHYEIGVEGVGSNFYLAGSSGPTIFFPLSGYRAASGNGWSNLQQALYQTSDMGPEINLGYSMHVSFSGRANDPFLTYIRSLMRSYASSVRCVKEYEN